MEQTTWSPERKILGAAVATVVMVAGQMVFPTIDFPVGLEGAVAVLVAYMIPNAK